MYWKLFMNITSSTFVQTISEIYSFIYLLNIPHHAPYWFWKKSFEEAGLFFMERQDESAWKIEKINSILGDRTIYYNEKCSEYWDKFTDKFMTSCRED